MSPHLLRVPARLCTFRCANGKVSAARQNGRVRPRGHLIASMEMQAKTFLILHNIRDRPIKRIKTTIVAISKGLPFQAWIYHCHLHPLQAAILDFEWRWLEVGGKWKKVIVIIKTVPQKNILQRFRKLSHSSEFQNDALMHREGLKGYFLLTLVGEASESLAALRGDLVGELPGLLLGETPWDTRDGGKRLFQDCPAAGFEAGSSSSPSSESPGEKNKNAGRLKGLTSNPANPCSNPIFRIPSTSKSSSHLWHTSDLVIFTRF